MIEDGGPVVEGIGGHLNAGSVTVRFKGSDEELQAIIDWLASLE